MNIFVKPACGEGDIVVAILVWCMCVHCACMHPSIQFCRGITSTFVHGFQNNMAQLMSRSAI